MDPKKVRQAKTIVGNNFELTVLLQKRCQELVRGARKLVDFDSNNLLEIALEEILQGKIWLSEEAAAPPSKDDGAQLPEMISLEEPPKVEGVEEIKIYKCPHCEYEGTSKGGLTLHMKVHEKAKENGGVTEDVKEAAEK